MGGPTDTPPRLERHCCSEPHLLLALMARTPGPTNLLTAVTRPMGTDCCANVNVKNMLTVRGHVLVSSNTSSGDPHDATRRLASTSAAMEL